MKCSFSEEIASYLASLKEELEQYFLEVPSYEYITNPFSVTPHDLAVGTGEQEELIDLQEDNDAKIRHRDCPAINFWLDVAHHTYADLSCCFTVVNISIKVGM